MGQLLGGFLQPEDARRAVEDSFPKHALLWGTPEEVLEKIRFFVNEIKPTRLLLHMNAGGIAHEKVVRSMQLFADRILPSLKDGD
jgi:hypothetical protein